MLRTIISGMLRPQATCLEAPAASALAVSAQSLIQGTQQSEVSCSPRTASEAWSSPCMARRASPSSEPLLLQHRSSALTGLSASCMQPMAWGAMQWHAWRGATKKAGGQASQKGATIPKNLGVKMHDGELIFPGQIIIRQRGTRFHPADGVGIGRDHTIFATRVGYVEFTRRPLYRMANGKIQERKYIGVKPLVASLTKDEEGKLGQLLVERRATIKRDFMRKRGGFEPALWFPLVRKDRSTAGSLEQHNPWRIAQPTAKAVGTAGVAAAVKGGA